MPNLFFQRTVNGSFKGTARLTFPSNEEAKQFKQKANYLLIKGRTLWLTPFMLDKSFKDKKNEKM